MRDLKLTFNRTFPFRLSYYSIFEAILLCEMEGFELTPIVVSTCMLPCNCCRNIAILGINYGFQT